MQTDIQARRQTDIQASRQTDIKASRQADRHKGKQAEGHKGKQAGSQTNGRRTKGGSKQAVRLPNRTKLVTRSALPFCC